MKSQKWLAVLSGLLSLALGIYLFINPDVTVSGLSWLLAFIMFFTSVTEFSTYVSLPREVRSFWGWVSVLINLFFGSYLLFGGFLALPIVLPTVVGLWLLLISLIRLFQGLSGQIPFLSNLKLILGVLGILFSLLLLIHPLLASLVIGYVVAISIIYHGLSVITLAFKN